ncbi:hypothetical protein D9M72_405050 [compost metagenome]
MPRKVSMVSAMQAAISASLVTSTATKRQRSGCRSATLRPPCWSMSTTTTLAPAETRADTTASPIIVAPPVTIAVLPSIPCMSVSTCCIGSHVAMCNVVWCSGDDAAIHNPPANIQITSRRWRTGKRRRWSQERVGRQPCRVAGAGIRSPASAGQRCCINYCKSVKRSMPQGYCEVWRAR